MFYNDYIIIYDVIVSYILFKYFRKKRNHHFWAVIVRKNSIEIIIYFSFLSI